MKPFRWNETKAADIRKNKHRGGVSFEEFVTAYCEGNLLDIVRNKSINHPTQTMFVIEINNYAYCVPFVEGTNEIFLKTMFPSRAYTARYLKVRYDENDN